MKRIGRGIKNLIKSFDLTQTKLVAEILTNFLKLKYSINCFGIDYFVEPH